MSLVIVDDNDNKCHMLVSRFYAKKKQLHGQDQDRLLLAIVTIGEICIIFQHRRQYTEYVLECAGNYVFVWIGILDTR